MPVHDDLSFVIGLFAILGAVFFRCLWRYRAARIQIDARGITQYAPFGRRFLAWPDVQDFYQSGGDSFVFGNVVGADKRRIRFWLGIADAEKLKDEIARSSSHCGHRSWREQEKQAALPNG